MDRQPVVLFENEDIDVLRYQRDYPKIMQLKGSYLQSSPDSVYSHANSYDQLYNDVIVYFRQNGEADTYLHQVISTKEKVALPFSTPEEDFYMAIMLSQLISDNSGPTLLKTALDNKDLLFVKSLPFRPDNPFRARRRLEVYFRMFLQQQARIDLSGRSLVMEEIFSDLLALTLKSDKAVAHYAKYKGLYLYDRFMLEMLLVAKTKTLKLAMTLGHHTGDPNLPWMVSYLYALADLLRIENSKDFYSKNAMLHLTWEICNIFLTLSQVNLVRFEDVMSGMHGFSLFDYLGSHLRLPQPDSFESGLVFLFGCYIHFTTMSDIPAEPSKREQQKYDDTNLFDLKLQEFFIITFTTAKVELHEYFKNLQDNKFPKLLVIFNQLYRGSLGNLAFFSRQFPTNHDVNFRVSLAFILFEHGEYLRCESVVKQILEKESPGLQTKLATVYRLAVLLFSARVAEHKKALLYSKELLNVAPRVIDKRSVEASQMYVMHAYVYFKLAASSRYESNRIAMKSNALDNLKIAQDLDVDNYWAKLLRGLLLLDVGFKEREGLKLLQEVNTTVPHKPIPMLCLALAFGYCQDAERALLVMKEFLQRFTHHSHLCYIFLAYFRVQEILQKFTEDRPIVPEFKQEGLELKEPEEEDSLISPLFTEAHVWEVELLFKKAIAKLLSKYNLQVNLHEVNYQKISELADANVPPELLLNYEQTLIYWAKLLVIMKKWEKVAFILSLADTKKAYYSADLAYLQALVCYSIPSHPDILGCEKAVRIALKADPLHHESLILLASIHLKNKDMMPASEAETLLANALALYESKEALTLLAHFKSQRLEYDAALEVYVRAFALAGNRPLLTLDALDLSLDKLFSN